MSSEGLDSTPVIDEQIIQIQSDKGWAQGLPVDSRVIDETGLNVDKPIINELRRVDSFNEDRYDEALNHAKEAQGFWGDDTLNFKPVKIVTLRETKKEGKEAIERILVMTPQVWQKERERLAGEEIDTRLPLEKFRESVTAETLKDAPSVAEVGFFLPGYQVVRFEGELSTNQMGLDAGLKVVVLLGPEDYGAKGARAVAIFERDSGERINFVTEDEAGVSNKNNEAAGWVSLRSDLPVVSQKIKSGQRLNIWLENQQRFEGTGTQYPSSGQSYLSLSVEKIQTEPEPGVVRTHQIVQALQAGVRHFNVAENRIEQDQPVVFAREGNHVKDIRELAKTGAGHLATNDDLEFLSPDGGLVRVGVAPYKEALNRMSFDARYSDHERWVGGDHLVKVVVCQTIERAHARDVYKQRVIILRPEDYDKDLRELNKHHEI